MRLPRLRRSTRPRSRSGSPALLAILLATVLAVPLTAAPANAATDAAVSTATATTTATATATTTATAKPADMGAVTFVDTGWSESTGITLTADWADVARAARYDVFVSTDMTAIYEMTTPTVSVTSSTVTLTKLKEKTRYGVRVVAVNDLGRGKFATRADFTTPTAGTANLAWQTSKPADMGTVVVKGTSWRSGTGSGTGSAITIDWPDAARATNYEVYVSSNLTTIYDMTTPTMTVTSSKATVTGLKPQVKYGIRVVSVNNMGRGKFSVRTDFTTPSSITANLPWQTAKPGDMGLVTYTKKSLTSSGATLTVDWADVARATSYDVFVSTSYDAVLTMTKPTMTVLTSTATATRLQKGVNYYIRVVPVNNLGKGKSSARVGHQTIAAEGSGGTAYSIMTWNVCSNACSNFAGRKPIIDARIRELAPDLVGLQEASRYTSAPSGYSMAFNGQNDILVRNGVFAKVGVKNGVPTSDSTKFKRQYSAIGQGLSWVALRHKSGAHVLAVSVHLPVGNSAAQMKQRQYEAQQVISYATATRTRLAKTYGAALKNATIIFVGDFNSSKSTSGDTTTALLRQKGWYDAFDQARSLTGQHYNTANPGMSSTPLVSVTWGAPIDKVLVEPSRTTVTSWANAGKMSGGKWATPLGSDHHPVLVKGTFGGRYIAPPAAQLPAGVSRVQGDNRYGTSAAVSRATFAPGVPVAYLASGANFPDALSGAAAAGVNDAPVLLTKPDALPTEIRTELTRLKPQRIVVLGGPVAVKGAVLTQAKAYTTGSVKRISGENRYETSVAVSKSAFKPGVDVAYLAAGENFPDALSGAAAAAKLGGPVLLTSKGSLPPVVKDELKRLTPKKIVVLGGPVAVSNAVVTASRPYAPTVTRAQGETRYGTSAAISKTSFDPGVPVAYVAVGGTFPDALSGAAAAGMRGGPVLLVGATSIPDETKTELTRLKPKKIVVLGGPVAVDDVVAVGLGGYIAP